MDQQRWKTITEIFDAALKVDETERRTFVARASGNDSTLAKEVIRLLDADAKAGSYLSSRLIKSDDFSRSGLPSAVPGDVLCQRFKIVRFVGAGGMGQVFEAADLELGVQVALKMIRPQVAENPEVLARFRREVRLARGITHPNVCRTFDLEREVRDLPAGEKEERVFLTMEFLEGETLAERIKREGALQLGDAMGIARQVAAGIEAARSIGVIHRDIKPGNIMLVPGQRNSPGLRAVITDFGLARIDSVDDLKSSSGIARDILPIGTLAYMAPEQLEGTHVSPATDVYAFGLVLFEMATGKRAFAASNFLSGIAQRLAGTLPVEPSMISNLPEHWRRTIEGCLRLKPEERFASAMEAVAALEDPSLRRAAKRSPQHWKELGAAPRIRTRIAAALAVLVAAVSLCWIGLRYISMKADPKVPPGALIYLAPLENSTGDTSMDNMTELLKAGLAQSVHINLVDENLVEDLLQRMARTHGASIDEPTGREIALRAGAVRVVFGKLRRSAGVYRFDLDVQEPDSTPARYRNHWTKSYTWESTAASGSNVVPEELLKTVRDASEWIRFEVGESQNDIARLDAPPEDVTTRNWEALEDFIQADKLNAQNRREDALPFLRKAVQADPDFALAYARLGDLLFSLDRVEDGYDAYKKALSEGLANRLTRHERDLIKGTYAVDTFDFTTAEETYRDCSAYYENDRFCIFFRAYPLRMLGRPQDAIVLMNRMIQLSPSTAGIYNQLTQNYLLLGDLNSARSSIVKLRAAGRVDQANMFEGHLAFLEGRFADAATDFDLLKSASAGMDRTLGAALLARLAAEQGHIEDALATLKAGIEIDSARKDHQYEAAKRLDMAYLYSRRGDWQGCAAETRRAIELSADPSGIISGASAIGFFSLHNHGIAPETRVRLLQEIAVRVPARANGVIFDMARHIIKGEILLAQGKTKQAIAEFEAADVLDAPITSRENLARAYAILASESSGKATQSEFRAKSLAYYERIALKPETVWCHAMSYPPGFVGDQVEDALGVARISQPTSAVDDLQKVKHTFRTTSTETKGDQGNVNSMGLLWYR